MGSFPPSFSFVYVLVAVDYVSKRMDALATRTNDHKLVVKFVNEDILCQYGIPRALINDGCSHCCRRSFEALLGKYCMTHKVATTYHL